MAMICQVYRSSRREGMYLYVDRSSGLDELPEALLATFGEPQAVMVLHLTPERRLARARAADILDSIQAQGYYLQLPPAAPVQRSRNPDDAGA